MRPKDFKTIEEAKAFSQTRGELISRNQMNALLAGAGIYVAFKKIADTDGHPFQNMIAAFLDATQYDFIQTSEIGLQNTAVLDAMIGAGLPESPALAALKPVIMAKSNITSNPYSGITDHEWMLTKGTMPRVQVEPAKGFLQVTYKKPVPQHAPNLWVYHEAIDHMELVGSLGTVGEARTYTIKPPRNTPMLLDNAYNAIK